jgi:lipid-A-disaccharide synthase
MRLLLGVAPALDPAAVQQSVAASPLRVRVVQDRTPEVIRAADLLLAVSGTVTLEAAVLGTPMIITYRVGLLSAIVGRLLIRVDHIGLPNLVAGKRIVPELIQFQATPERLAAIASEILGSPDRQAEMRAALAEVRGRLGTPGATDRAAREVLALLPAA